MKNEAVIGILGGMGPEATVDFMAKVIAMTDARRDQDHVTQDERSKGQPESQHADECRRSHADIQPRSRRVRKFLATAMLWSR